MFNHLFLQGKCTCVTFVYHILLRFQFFIPACGRHIWEISKLALILVKILVTRWQFVGYNQNLNFCPTCQSNLFLVTWFVAGYLGNFAFGPILCSNLWLVVLLNRKFLLFLSLFGTLAIKAMTFWEILISSKQNLPFLKCVKGVL